MLEIYTTKYEQWLFHYDGNIVEFLKVFFLYLTCIVFIRKRRINVLLFDWAILKQFILYLITPNQMLLFYFDNDDLIKINPLSTKLSIKSQLVAFLWQIVGCFPLWKWDVFPFFCSNDTGFKMIFQRLLFWVTNFCVDCRTAFFSSAPQNLTYCIWKIFHMQEQQLNVLKSCLPASLSLPVLFKEWFKHTYQ